MLKVQTAGYIFQEQRRSVREQVELNAKGIIPDGDTVIDCTILDISETGALLQLETVDIIPERFRLSVPERHMRCECRVVRKSGKFLGIEFQTDTDLKQDSEKPVVD